MTLSRSSQHAIDDIKSRVGKERKLVFVSGFFNIVHPGHLRLLRFAAECGDFLVVGVYGDELGDSLIDEEVRLEGINAYRLVDYSFVLKDKTADIIRALEPAVVVKGKEHENAVNPEAEAVASYGGKMLFGSGDMSFSLAELLQDESQRIVTSSFVRNDRFMGRHNFSWAQIDGILNRFRTLKVVVIGDLIVDEYITCDSLGMSQEDPTIVVTPVGVELFLGGAGIVAAHASNLGAAVSFFSVTGDDEMVGFARKKLADAQVNARLFSDDTRPTILKQRYRSAGKTLLRVNHLRQHPVSKEIQQRMKSELFDILSDQDLLIFSDFNYGCLPQKLVEDIVAEFRKKNVMMVAD
ncbi:MAG TPA: ADP-heptose synthase, partial [Desulfobacteraceae bacterium]|nr:ADP-heptose synthase [Desulfobacteraceae bacterium]